MSLIIKLYFFTKNEAFYKVIERVLEDCFPMENQISGTSEGLRSLFGLDNKGIDHRHRTASCHINQFILTITVELLLLGINPNTIVE